MDYRIIKKEAFYIVGADGKIPLIYEGNNPHTADIWGKLSQADILILMGFTEMQPKGMLNVYYNYLDKQTGGSELNLFVGIATEDPSPIPQQFDRLPIEKSRRPHSHPRQHTVSEEGVRPDRVLLKVLVASFFNFK